MKGKIRLTCNSVKQVKITDGPLVKHVVNTELAQFLALKDLSNIARMDKFCE